jgi:hypothetical protein
MNPAENAVDDVRKNDPQNELKSVHRHLDATVDQKFGVNGPIVLPIAVQDHVHDHDHPQEMAVALKVEHTIALKDPIEKPALSQTMNVDDHQHVVKERFISVRVHPVTMIPIVQLVAMP